MCPRASSLMCVVYRENLESEGGSLEKHPPLRLPARPGTALLQCGYSSPPLAVSSGVRDRVSFLSGSLGPKPRLTRRRDRASV